MKTEKKTETKTITLNETANVGGVSRRRGWSGDASEGEARSLVTAGRATYSDGSEKPEPKVKGADDATRT